MRAQRIPHAGATQRRHPSLTKIPLDGNRSSLRDVPGLSTWRSQWLTALRSRVPARCHRPGGRVPVAHHGGADIADLATFAAFRPRVAIMNNGLKKGGARTTHEALHRVPHLEDRLATARASRCRR